MKHLILARDYAQASRYIDDNKLPRVDCHFIHHPERLHGIKPPFEVHRLPGHSGRKCSPVIESEIERLRDLYGDTKE